MKTSQLVPGIAFIDEKCMWIIVSVSDADRHGFVRVMILSVISDCPSTELKMFSFEWQKNSTHPFSDVPVMFDPR